jgi:hypothetical protein
MSEIEHSATTAMIDKEDHKRAVSKISLMAVAGIVRCIGETPNLNDDEILPRQLAKTRPSHQCAPFVRQTGEQKAPQTCANRDLSRVTIAGRSDWL